MLDGIKHIYFLGIGGIGMSALARYFNSRGIKISGYDKTPSSLTSELIAEGMHVHFEDDPALVPADVDFVVLTPAIPADHKEWAHIRSKNIPVKKRAEVLGMISKSAVCLAVAGTHGKTTTTTLLAHLLRSSGVNCTAFLGGVSANYMTNYLQGDHELVVVEADEYDRSFLHLEPAGAVITSMDADHLDIYGDHDAIRKSFCEFAGRVKPNGELIVNQKLNFNCGTYLHPDTKVHTYGLDGGDGHAANIHVHNGSFVFDYLSPKETISELALAVPGRHNVENATAAISLAKLFGGTSDGIRKGIQSFKGVHRRFEFALRTDKCVVIDDYAHHPEELKAAITAAKELYPGKKITGVFQPHLFSRTRDFADQFARSLELLDNIVLLDIYPARELPIPGVTSAMLLELIQSESKYLVQKQELINVLDALNAEIILMMGAGDIDRLVAPVADAMKKKGGSA